MVPAMSDYTGVKDPGRSKSGFSLDRLGNIDGERASIGLKAFVPLSAHTNTFQRRRLVLKKLAARLRAEATLIDLWLETHPETPKQGAPMTHHEEPGQPEEGTAGQPTPEPDGSVASPPPIPPGKRVTPCIMGKLLVTPDGSMIPIDKILGISVQPSSDDNAHRALINIIAYIDETDPAVPLAANLVDTADTAITLTRLAEQISEVPAGSLDAAPVLRRLDNRWPAGYPAPEPF